MPAGIFMTDPGKNAADKVHYQTGVVLRRAIAELDGTIPEDLPTAESIKKLERAEKRWLAAPKSKGKQDDDKPATQNYTDSVPAPSYSS